MKWPLTGIFSIIYLCSGAQIAKPTHIDSLERKLNIIKPGKEKRTVQNVLFFYYLKKNSKKALTLAKSALIEAQESKKDSAVCLFLDDIGEAYYYLEDFDASLQYLNKCNQLASKINYKQQEALSFSDMSGDYQSQSNYLMAEAYSFKALAIYDQLKDYRMIALCNLNLGVVYNNQNDFKKSIIYAHKGLEALKKIPHNDIRPHAYVVLASGFAGENKLPEARGYYSQALKEFTAANDDYDVATVLSLLSSLYPGDYQKELILALRARQLWDKVAPDNFTSISNLGDLGTIYGKMAIVEKDVGKRRALFKNSIAYLSKAINTGRKTNTKSVIVDYTDSLSMINAAMGNFKEAYANLIIHNKLYDSIYSQENKNKIASLEGKHEIELRDKQLLINKFGNNRSAQTASVPDNWFGYFVHYLRPYLQSEHAA